MSLTPSASPALASGASVGTSPKFDLKSLYAIQNSRVEFERLGGGRRQGYYEELCCWKNILTK